MPVSPEEIANRFTYHAPKEGQPELYGRIRDAVRDVAEFVVANTPESREQALALTHLEEAVFWANAAVARRG